MQYIPQIVEERGGDVYATFVLHLRRCGACRKPMLAGKLTPDVIEQLQRAGFGREGSTLDEDDRHVCIECEQADRVMFVCVLCGEKRPSSQSQWHCGDPAEHLCRHCYETVSAQIWEQKVDQIEECHRYDFD